VGILLREFTHGHTRQLSAVLRRHLVALAGKTQVQAGIGERAFNDIDSLLRPVYRHPQQGASFGHTKIAGKTILRRGSRRWRPVVRSGQAEGSVQKSTSSSAHVAWAA
jgi:hypothetical protein